MQRKVTNVLTQGSRLGLGLGLGWGWGSGEALALLGVLCAAAG